MYHSTDVSFIASQALARSQQKAGEEPEMYAETNGQAIDAMATIDQQARAPLGFVAASTGPEGGNRTKKDTPVTVLNSDALELDIDDN